MATPARFTPGDEEARRRAQRARSLVKLSRILAASGLGAILLAFPIGARSGALAGIAAALGFIVLIAAAIVGQVGRALQGRVI
jgi:hypothetical protein